MTSLVQSQPRNHYSGAINNVIVAGDRVLDRLSADQARQDYALQRLSGAVETLLQQTLNAQAPPSSPDDLFSTAAVEMQAGYVLIAAGKGDKNDFNGALENLRAEKSERSGDQVEPLLFDADLLKAPLESATDMAALNDFKGRASRTLDNMVQEADDVFFTAVGQFVKDFDQFWQSLKELVNTFAVNDNVNHVGAEAVISSLKRLAHVFQSDRLQEMLNRLKDMVKEFKLKDKVHEILEQVYGCEGTKDNIDNLMLSDAVNRTTLLAAGVRMAELSRQYCLVLKQVRRVMAIVSAMGGVLVLAGAAHYATLGLPVAYALVALATLLIGVTFAEARMRSIISSL